MYILFAVVSHVPNLFGLLRLGGGIPLFGQLFRSGLDGLLVRLLEELLGGIGPGQIGRKLGHDCEACTSAVGRGMIDRQASCAGGAWMRIRLCKL